MFGILLKAAVAVVAAPVALVVDIVTLPASAEHPTRGAFDRTADMLDASDYNIKQAVKNKS